jgi:fructose-1,6-bisphosphatase II
VAPEQERARCVCTDLVAVTERSALATGRCLGRGDAPEALHAGAEALREAFSDVAFRGRVALGIDELLPAGLELGKGGEAGDYDLAIGPLQEAIVASGEAGAISVIAAADPGTLVHLPDMLVRWMAAGPVARDRLDLLAPIEKTVHGVAEAFGRGVSDVTALVLNRPRHEDLIEDIRKAGARIKLYQDGDVIAVISAAVRGTNDHLAVGIGSTSEAVISAAALRSLGGAIQAQLWPVSRTQVRLARDAGIEDVSQVFTTQELVRGHAIVSATGVSNGDLLRGVRYVGQGARTHSILMCSHCNRVRFVDTTHVFSRSHALEIRV